MSQGKFFKEGTPASHKALYFGHSLYCWTIRPILRRWPLVLIFGITLFLCGRIAEFSESYAGPVEAGKGPKIEVVVPDLSISQTWSELKPDLSHVITDTTLPGTTQIDILNTEICSGNTVKVEGDHSVVGCGTIIKFP